MREQSIKNPYSSEHRWYCSLPEKLLKSRDIRAKLALPLFQTLTGSLSNIFPHHKWHILEEIISPIQLEQVPTCQNRVALLKMTVSSQKAQRPFLWFMSIVADRRSNFSFFLLIPQRTHLYSMQNSINVFFKITTSLFRSIDIDTHMGTS